MKNNIIKITINPNKEETTIKAILIFLIIFNSIKLYMISKGISLSIIFAIITILYSPSTKFIFIWVVLTIDLFDGIKYNWHIVFTTESFGNIYIE